MKQNIEDLLADQCKRVNELLNTSVQTWNGGVPCVGNYHTQLDPSPKLVQIIDGGGYQVICDATSAKSLSKMIDAFISGITAAHEKAG